MERNARALLALAAVVGVLAMGVVIGLALAGPDPAPVARSWDAYFACVETADTDDPAVAERECGGLVP